MLFGGASNDSIEHMHNTESALGMASLDSTWELIYENCCCNSIDCIRLSMVMRIWLSVHTVDRG